MSAPRITVATSFPIFPPRGGGQRRVLGLYAAVARSGVEVDIVALVSHGTRAGARRIAPGVREIRVAKTAEHESREAELQRGVGMPVTDVALTLLHDLTPEYAAAIAASARDARAIILSHPFAYPAVPSASPPLIYEAHNVEFDLKSSMFGEGEQGRRLSDVVQEVEAACCSDGRHVIVCSTRDGERLGELYEVDKERVMVVPNGVDTEALEFVDAERRAGNRERLGLASSFHAIFIGSWHEPNLVAVRDILNTAPLLPDVRFLIVGSAGDRFANDPIPDNVDLCGVVADAFIRSVLGFADAALNPMRFGSGTNLKMLEYGLAGVPLISSEFGARGLGLEPGQHFLAAEPDELALAIAQLKEEPAGSSAARAAALDEVVRTRFSWSGIASAWLGNPAMRELLQGVPALP